MNEEIKTLLKTMYLMAISDEWSDKDAKNLIFEGANLYIDYMDQNINTIQTIGSTPMMYGRKGMLV